MVDQNQTTHTPRRYPQGEWPAILEGLGDTGRKIVAQDWSATPLGDIASWPSPLRTALSIVLASHQPMVLWWGEDLIQLHNDAYDELMSERAAPASIGQPAQNALPMDWQVLLDDMRKVIQVGEPMRLTDAHLPRPNDPDMREHYFCISVDPLFRDDGSIAGALAVLCESTQGVVRERRLSMLNDLAGSIRIADDPTAVSTLAVQSIGKNRGDVCFALIYLFDHLVREAQLVATSGEGADRAPTELEMEMTRSWPLDRAAAGEASILLDPRDMSGTSFGEGVEGLGWISILPLDATHNGRPHGALVIGTSAAVHIDDSYREFLEVTADQIAAGIEARFQLFERTNAVNVVRHRMQNNLQLISSLFSLTRGRIADWLASQEMESLDDRLAQLGL
ncbi:MAG: hypothetical protein KKB63_05765, partial [Alphaproteobacteria bacterium]|nr:hypothetical protein [Alphaproteobacteria bacterium]